MFSSSKYFHPAHRFLGLHSTEPQVPPVREPEQATRVVRFGVFEVDLQTAELRKQGVRIRLSGQSFQVLESLLLRPGELVTREELKQKLWPENSYGDFEHGINTAVNRVREALGDSSDNPRFVETIPRRGYRFIAPVNGEPRSAAELQADLKPPTRDTDPNRAGHRVSLELDASAQAEGKSGSRNRLRRRILTGVAILAVGVAVGVWYLHRPLPPPRISGYAQLTRDGRRRWLTGVDESRLYINSLSGGPIYQVGIDGGEMVPVPVAVPGISPMVADVSPDGSSLLVGSEEKGKPTRALWNVRIPDSSYRRLGYALDAAFSPDRSSVAYTTPEGDIWLVRSDGTGGHKLGSAGARPIGPPGRLTAESSGLTRGTGFGRYRRTDRIFMKSSLAGTARIYAAATGPPTESCTYSRPGGPRSGLLMSGADFGKHAPSQSIGHRANRMGSAVAQQGRQENLRIRLHRTRRTHPRPSDQSPQAVSGRHLRRQCHVLQRQSVRGLCLLSGWHPLESQPGWKQTSSTDGPSHETHAPTLVARWLADSVHGWLIGPIHCIYRPIGRRHPQTDSAGQEWGSKRSELVGRRKQDCFLSGSFRGFKERSEHPRHLQPPGHSNSRIRWHRFAALVAGWPVHSREHNQR